MKLAYKGTDKNMSCRDIQYDFDRVYIKDFDAIVRSQANEGFSNMFLIEEDKGLRLCSDQGFHYCSKLDDVFTHFKNDGENRFFEIEILGRYNEDSNKGITRAFRIIKEITKEDLSNRELHKKLKLDSVQKFLTDFPTAIVGGSLGLFLAGAKLKRVIKDGVGDVDIILPYYVDIASKDYVHSAEDLPSGNDFDTSFLVDGRKFDVVVDPKRKYKEIEYKGFTYKVADYRQTLLAKLNYSLKGGKKHTEDLEELLLGKFPEGSDLPF